MQIAVASSSSVGIPILDSLLAGPHEVKYVLSNPDKGTGRGQKFVANDFALHSASHSVKVVKSNSQLEIQETLLTDPVDLVITVAYGKLIGKQALSIPKFGWINVHFSKLPRWRGAAPVQYALLNQDKETGVSIFQLDEGMDTGPIYLARDYPIAEAETTPTLLSRLANEASHLIADVLKLIIDGQAPVPQSDEGVTHAPKISKEEGKIDCTRSVSEILSQVRALSQNPGVFLAFRGERLGINAAEESSFYEGPEESGSLVARKHELLVRVSDGAIRLLSVTPQGKKEMSGSDFARGARIQPGDRVE